MSIAAVTLYIVLHWPCVDEVEVLAAWSTRSAARAFCEMKGLDPEASIHPVEGDPTWLLPKDKRGLIYDDDDE